MNTFKALRIDYRFQNWGKTERIICEQEDSPELSFQLFKQGRIVGTIYKKGLIWKSSGNSIFLPADIQKIGNYIETYLQHNNPKVHR